MITGLGGPKIDTLIAKLDIRDGLNLLSKVILKEDLVNLRYMSFIPMGLRTEASFPLLCEGFLFGWGSFQDSRCALRMMGPRCQVRTDAVGHHVPYFRHHKEVFWRPSPSSTLHGA